MRKTWDTATAHTAMTHELFWLAIPYGVMVTVIVLMIVTMCIKRMPEDRDKTTVRMSWNGLLLPGKIPPGI